MSVSISGPLVRIVASRKSDVLKTSAGISPQSLASWAHICVGHLSVNGSLTETLLKDFTVALEDSFIDLKGSFLNTIFQPRALSSALITRRGLFT